MANLKYRKRGKSPASGKLNYKPDGHGEFISTRPINFKITVQMDPDHSDPVKGEVKLELGNIAKGFYAFKDIGDTLIISFENKKKDFDVDIGSDIIMKSGNPDKIPLKVYLTVKAKGGVSFPKPIEKGKYIWEKGDITLPLDNLLKNLKAMNLNLNDLL